MREDTYTSTVDGARGFEFMRAGGGYGSRDDLPTAADLAEDIAEDRRREARQRAEDDAARARGEYVPSALMRLCVSALRWRHPWAHPAREDATHGVAWIQGVTVETVGLDDRYEVAAGNDGVWVRFPLSMMASPW